MARSLEDVVRRRIPLVLLSRLSDQSLRETGSLVGEHLGWSDARVRDEVESIRAEHGRPDCTP
jgi:glycerol-3-phosphate dehydrogenase